MKNAQRKHRGMTSALAMIYLTVVAMLAVGFYTAVVCLTYAPVRFVLDFLRATDVPESDRRYASLTFAQWFCVGMFAAGVAVVARMRRGLDPSLSPRSGPSRHTLGSGHDERG